jgi:hypothetical protein
MQPFDNFDLIDKYLRNEMTPEEALAFEKTLAHNPELRKEVEIRYDIMVGIRAAEQKHILEELDKIDNQKVLNIKQVNTKHFKVVQTKKNKSISQNQYKKMGILIIMIVVLIILFLLFQLLAKK